MPYHRYSPEDPEHEHVPTACFNSLNHEMDRLRAELDAAKRALWVCAFEAGEDQEGDSYHVLTSPSVEQYAIEAVRWLRREYEGCLDQLDT